MARGAAKSTSTRIGRFASGLPLDPVHRYGRWLSLMSDEQRAELCTEEFTARWGQTRSFDLLERRWAESDATAAVEKLAHADIGMYLPDDLLVKMDIASMAHSLEVRSPLLDHHVVEFAAALPLSLKLRGRNTKYLLKKVMGRYLPAEVINRRKMGFGVPIDHWLRDGLPGMAHDLSLIHI